MATNEEVIVELEKINVRIDRLKKAISDYLFLMSEMKIGSLRAALKNV